MKSQSIDKPFNWQIIGDPGHNEKIVNRIQCFRLKTIGSVCSVHTNTHVLGG